MRAVEATEVRSNVQSVGDLVETVADTVEISHNGIVV